MIGTPSVSVILSCHFIAAVAAAATTVQYMDSVSQSRWWSDCHCLSVVMAAASCRRDSWS